jgi:hypothetical protein
MVLPLDHFLLQEASFLEQDASFLLQEASFLEQEASFFEQEASFLLQLASTPDAAEAVGAAGALAISALACAAFLEQLPAPHFFSGALAPAQAEVAMTVAARAAMDFKFMVRSSRSMTCITACTMT